MLDVFRIVHISDLSLLKITKVKPWVIYFDCDGKHYFVKGCSELGEGSWQELYERTLDENGKYSLTKLNVRNYATDSVAHEYIRRQKGNTIVYSQIDKVYFAYMLTKHGFAYGIMESAVKEVADSMAEVEKRIKAHEKEISLLKKQKREIADSVLGMLVLSEVASAVKKALLRELNKK